MRSLINVALVCAATLGSLSVAEAMPVAVNPSSTMSSVGDAQIEKTVMVVRKTVIVRRRPMMMMRRRPRVMRKVIITR